MKCLLDTNAWYWLANEPDKFGRKARAIVEDPDNDLYVSTVSMLEFGQLAQNGRIVFRGTVGFWVDRGIGAFGLKTADMTREVALLAYALPGTFHRDPADRMLVATAITLGLTLVTADEKILAYPHVVSLDSRK